MSLGSDHAGEQVWSWIYSDPIALGTQTVAADGTIRLTAPASLPAGTHTIAIEDRTGAVLGWDTVGVAAANALPGGATGLDEGPAGMPAAFVVLAVVLALTATGLAFGRTRRRRAAEG